jgi:hypothetical protein
MSSSSKDEEFLKIKRTAAEIKNLYDSDPRQKGFNLLLLGETGTGKSTLFTTCPKPVHVDCFDPGGIKHLRPEISKGEIIPAIWEGDDPFKPDRFVRWERRMKELIQLSYFDHIGTYCLDSATTWSAAIMNEILKRAGLAGETPRFTHDYQPQKTKIVNWLKVLLNLPCNVIITGHLEAKKDDVSGVITYRFMTTGKAEVTIPLEFDEIWVTDTKATSKGINYRIVTARTGPYLASTRIGRGKFDTYEKPDIGYLLKKAGLDANDKPLLI